MAQPQEYNRTKDFTVDFQNETDHSALNSELDGASTSINQLRANLMLIQADDGGLRPQAVTVDSLSDDLKEMLMGEVAVVNADTRAAAESAQATLLQIQQELHRVELLQETFNIINYKATILGWLTETLNTHGVFQFATMAEFPNVGSENALYIDKAQGASYRWDDAQHQYICVGRDWETIRTIEEQANG